MLHRVIKTICVSHVACSLLNRITFSTKLKNQFATKDQLRVQSESALRAFFTCYLTLPVLSDKSLMSSVKSDSHLSCFCGSIKSCFSFVSFIDLFFLFSYYVSFPNGVCLITG